MNEKIFSNALTLNLTRREITRRYNDNREESILKHKNRISLLMIIINTINLSLEISLKLNSSTIYFYISLISLAIVTITSIFNFFCRKVKYLKLSNGLSYLTLTLTILTLRTNLNQLSTFETELSIFILMCDTLIRFSFIACMMFGYLEHLLLNLINIILVWAVIHQIEIKNSQNLVYKNLNYSLFLILITALSYYLEKIQKTNFSFRYVQGNKLRCLTDVFEKIDSGFILIRRNKISFINTFLKRNLYKFLQGNNKPNEADTNVKRVMSELLEQIGVTNVSNLYSLIVRYLSKLEGINDFLLIGSKIISNDGSEFHYEISCKYTKSITNGDQLTFLFHDVTKTQLREKQIAEFKYKTVFLSKVAHEFKNPIICITELVNQIAEKGSEDSETGQILTQITSMSNYLLILVKDLNYFSESQLGKDLTIEEKETNLDDLLLFCKNITQSLLKKNNKFNDINFEINKQIGFDNPTVLIDEWRLKQVLINLLSNAVKFTLYGRVTLEITQENIQNINFIQFKVSDTGPGMEEEEKQNLLKPFQKGKNKNNEFGSGLGLNIVNDICLKMGGYFKLESKVGEGSSFAISLPLKFIENNLTLKKLDESSNDEIILLTSRKESSKTITLEFWPGNFKTSIQINSPVRRQSCISIRKKLSDTNLGTIIETPPSDSSNEISLFNKFTVTDLVTSNDFMLSCLRSKTSSSELRKFNRKTINIIVADDEPFIRQSSMRILQKVSEDLGVKINVIEVEDGVECLYIVYKCISRGIKIDIILSDENMNFFSGTKSSVLIKELTEIKTYFKTNFYLVTAYDSNTLENFKSKTITKILSKPLERSVISNIIREISS